MGCNEKKEIQHREESAGERWTKKGREETQ